jgi:D-cysteine desulfhydrase
MDALRAAARPYLVGPGGSSPLGALGYVAAGLELAGQVDRGELPEPEAIYVALGSGGTTAGLALGCAAAGLRSTVVGVRVVEGAIMNPLVLRALIGRTRRLITELGGIVEGDVRVAIDAQEAGSGYGHETQAAREALRRAREAGLELETTYTAKALAGLLARRPSGNVLFMGTYDGRPVTRTRSS